MSNIDDLPARVRETTDREELRDLLTRLFHGIDTRKRIPELVRAVFTESATAEFPTGEYAGRDDLTAGCRSFEEHWDTTLHSVTDHVVTVREDSAHIAATLLATHIAHDPAACRHLGANLGAEAVREPVGWRLQRLAVGLVWTECGQPPGDSARTQPASE